MAIKTPRYSFRKNLFLPISFGFLFAHRLTNCRVNAENDPPMSLKISPYEYIVNNTPARLKQIADEFFDTNLTEKIIDFYAPISVENELCRNQSLLYKHSFLKFDSWAIKMWDSSGKLPSGMLDANFYDLGNFYECLKVSEEGPFQVKYCLVEVKNFFPKPTHPQYSKFNELKAIFFGSLRMMKGNLYLARCVPDSCSNQDLENYYTSLVSRYNMSVDIEDYSCTASNQNDPLTTLDWAAIAFLAITIILIVTSTVVYRLYSNAEMKKKGFLIDFLLCYSLQKNCDLILTTKNLKTNLSFINGLRGLSCILIILAHMGIFYLSLSPRMNFLDVFKSLTKPDIKLVFLSSVNSVVDVFFVIGGLLTAYFYSKSVEEGKFNILLFYIKRIFRIVPPYAAQITLFITVIYRYVGSGPVWKMKTGQPRDNCLKNWWTNLLFINNYVRQDEMCIGTNWYLAVDMQLYLIAPLILILMIRSSNFRKYGIPLLILFFNLWTSYVSYMNEYMAGNMIDVNYKTEDTNQHIYIITQNRISGWLLGIYLGYILQRLEADPKKKKISEVTLWLGWILTASVQVLTVLSMYYFMSATYRINLIETLWNGFHRTIYAASICWLIYACELGYGGIIYEFLTWYPLQVAGRLAFMLYLSQTIVLFGIDSMTLTTLQFQPYMEARQALSNLIICFVQSFFLSLWFELPYANISKLILTGDNRVRNEKTKQM